MHIVPLANRSNFCDCEKYACMLVEKGRNKNGKQTTYSPLRNYGVKRLASWSSMTSAQRGPRLSMGSQHIVSGACVKSDLLWLMLNLSPTKAPSNIPGLSFRWSEVFANWGPQEVVVRSPMSWRFTQQVLTSIEIRATPSAQRWTWRMWYPPTQRLRHSFPYESAKWTMRVQNDFPIGGKYIACQATSELKQKYL